MGFSYDGSQHPQQATIGESHANATTNFTPSAVSLSVSSTTFVPKAGASLPASQSTSGEGTDTLSMGTPYRGAATQAAGA